MTNLEKASKAYDKLMNSIDDDKLIKHELERGGLEKDYTIDNLVNMIKGELEQSYWLLDECDDEEDADRIQSEIRRFKYFIKKWQNASNE